ncbi:response regulator transcription factor [Kitasatospora sp. NPDC054939]
MSPQPVAADLVLTDEQLAVLLGFARGLAPGQVAEQLGVSVHDVRAHLKRIFKALDVTNAAHAVGVASALGLITPAAILQGGPHVR